MQQAKASAAIGAILIAVVTTAASDGADPSLAQRGGYLARAGDCEACHTTPGGAPYAGGAAIHSPYGPLYAPNITPDKTNGIGAWSDEQFYRALHEGIDDHGRNLYPAFPYQWFTKVTRDDVLAIRAFLNTVPPSSEKSKPSHLMFPFDIRAGLTAWNALYFRPGEFKPDPAKGNPWNRGAYLVEGLGHCGDCHTPKGVAMEPETSKPFAGGDVDDWYAPNVTSDPVHGIGGWSEDDLVQYLKTGSSAGGRVAGGPMAQVVHESLAYLNDSDLHAIAIYLKDLAPIAEATPSRPSGEIGPHASGEGVYLTQCAFCHQPDGKGQPGRIPALAGNEVVTARGPEDVIRQILGGHLATGSYAPMPAVGATLTDQEIADVTDYVRNAWSNRAPVIAQTGLVGKIRAKTISTLAGPGATEEHNDPCMVGPDSQSVPTFNDPQIDQALSGLTDATMLQAIPPLIQRVRQIAPDEKQADIVNGLALAYCRLEARKAGFRKPNGRDRLNRFTSLVYGELVAKGTE
ncbi:mono/diheme cytochrome c family protein [Roseiarcus fermentans]|uniref:Mono/diheme cytochrome c family protein n=1 Tax=Roseiarcus fermentans TaxID=1473586 RepID=A0A366FGM2_9HYPH|nr:cytochrome c [Roseiarcus fermentans]RBP13751.1 mono/diheme cytochrome c family protein [Roseiarcus fermentans]